MNRLVLRLSLLTVSATAFAEEVKPTAEQLDFFEKKIRPVLSEKCYKCHAETSEKIKGALVLDTREGIRRGGDNGPAVIPGAVDDSLLIQAIRYSNKDTAMPPAKAGGKLPDATIKDFEVWIKMGAPDPRDGGTKVVKKSDAGGAKQWWSFQSPRKSDGPTVRGASWPRTDIDQFILAGLEAENLQPAADADKTTLLRRVYFDLTGLPPTLKQIDDFLQDLAPDAFARVVDTLLSSSQFGERWGRHWLDVARYAESSGKDVNIAYPHAWRYRDYVIAAFNAGKPYDQFLREQIAGDLLPAKDEKQRADYLVATGFLAIGPKSHNDQNPRQFYLDIADEQIDTLSQAALGMTIACARCHDHKFDPISQRDYYALAGIFLSTDTKYGTAPGLQNRHASDLLELSAAAAPKLLDVHQSPDERSRKAKQLETAQQELRSTLSQRFRGGPNAGPQDGRSQARVLQLVTQAGFLSTQLKSFNDDGSPKALAMGTKDLPNTRADDFAAGGRRFGGFGGLPGAGGRFGAGRPSEFQIVSDAHLYTRGDADRPGDLVPRGFPAALSTGAPGQIPNGTSGRLQLANFIASANNPLTARVFVNRTWYWLFGRGLVDSCDNFGTTGSRPSNQALLDTLAVQFVEDGWDIKRLIRRIVLTRTYAMSSAYDAKAFAADPDNTLLWRANKRRLEAECLRDAMLFASGQLSLNPPTASVIAENADGPIGGPRRQGGGAFFGGMRVPGTDEESITKAGGVQRSVYLPIARDVTPDALSVFDFVDSTVVNGTRDATNVPVQSLYLLNSDFVAEQSAKLAERVLQAYPAGPNGGATAKLEERMRYAYWLVFNRAPDAVEKQAALTFFAKFATVSAKAGVGTPAFQDASGVTAAWTSFCQSLFSAAEFRYLN